MTFKKNKQMNKQSQKGGVSKVLEIAISFCISAFFLALPLVPVAIRYAPALGLLDEPDGDRKNPC